MAHDVKMRSHTFEHMLGGEGGGGVKEKEEGVSLSAPPGVGDEDDGKVEVEPTPPFRIKGVRSVDILFSASKGAKSHHEYCLIKGWPYVNQTGSERGIERKLGRRQWDVVFGVCLNI